jgi:hypothetical protein
MVTLKDAQKKGKIKEFIKEREKQPPGDKDRFEKTLKSMTRGKSTKVRKTSRRDDGGN